MPRKTHDLTGQRFGMLLAVEKSGVLKKQTAWACVCDCGSITYVPAHYLVSGSTKSCGCTRPLRGYCNSPTHNSWRAMRERCLLPSHPHFRNYGGRGVTVCARWQEFHNFLADMGERAEGMTLDRYPNNDGNYEPGNCRWATRHEQAQNTRRKQSVLR